MLKPMKMDLLTDKGIYPYDYFDGFERFKERALPPKEAFYRKLSEEHVSDKDYERALKVWKHFGIKTLSITTCISELITTDRCI